MCFQRLWWSFACLALGLIVLQGCGSTPPPKPRTRDQIMGEMISLSQLYLTDKTNQRVIATGGKGRFWDEKTGEVCWPALCCNAPDCPARQADGTPFIFIMPDPGMKSKPDGTVDYDLNLAKAGRIPWDGFCPRCWEAKNLKALSPAQRQPYIEYVKIYELPESLKRRAELEAELKTWNTYVEERVKRKVTP